MAATTWSRWCRPASPRCPLAGATPTNEGSPGRQAWSGQEVRFCASNDPTTGRSARLRYLARVVNEGSFTWEPAIMQFPSAPELLAITPAGTVRIGTP